MRIPTPTPHHNKPSHPNVLPWAIFQSEGFRGISELRTARSLPPLFFKCRIGVRGSIPRTTPRRENDSKATPWEGLSPIAINPVIRRSCLGPFFLTEQMDAEGLGRKLLLTASGDPRKAPEKHTVGTVAASHEMLTLQALSSSLNAGAAKRGSLGRVPSSSLSPKPAASICTFLNFLCEGSRGIS